MALRVPILGVPIDSVTLREAVDRIEAMVQGGLQHHVMTPNPEMLVASRRDADFLSVLRRSSLNVPDGFGLLLAARFLGRPLAERVAGIDLLTSVCRHTEASVFLLGAASGVAERAASRLREMNPALRIAGTFAGSPRATEEDDVIRRVARSGATMLFVAYGAPVQDLWIARNLSRMPDVRVAMGVGGAFDFLAGVRSRAPRLLQRIGCEWLWRLAQEPSRIGRIFRAAVVFPVLVLLGGRRPADG